MTLAARTALRVTELRQQDEPCRRRWRDGHRLRHGVAPTPANVLGCVSLIVWSLLLVVTVKYVGVLMQADNRGEGGIIALRIVAGEQGEMGRFAESLFAFLSRNAANPTDFFELPSAQVVEVGARVDL